MASTSNISLDTLPSTTTPPYSSSPNEHLSFPTATLVEYAPEPPDIAHQQPRQLLKDRLYIGNLHPTVDEYSLLQIFAKYGKVTKLDFLFHKTGALKGKPRGYAFIEYGSNDEALKALNMAHDKLLRGRKLVVTFAHQAPIDQAGGPSIYGVPTIKRKGMMETGRPTTLSILKTGMAGKNDGTKDKIAMMEAKLRQMESSKPKPAQDLSSPASIQIGSSTSHPSLPTKPPPALPENHIPKPQARNTPQVKPTLPSLPILPPSQSTRTQPKAIIPRLPKSSKLAGVKIGKPKERQAAADAS